ncbi:MAG: chromosome segregation protein SMC [Eubacteriales bacterium]|nr:chromosome segregation protein SMC [Eubacteriales bacterium]
MRLTRLEINGFKSFCNKTEIIFPKNITGIVGPNGSGKSNIADAVRWVLGEQNPRLLRGGKMEDIIFNGTQKRKPTHFCEVSLIFDNEDKTLHPDYLEIMITRRVYRNGDSEYEINKTPCRLKDIIEMFSDTGIGKEGYSIIGQGKIDEILSRKTEDRRAVFEEAAGISYYKLKKHEAELRLARTEENLLRINDIAEEQSRLLGPLQEQAENAKRYLLLAEELKQLSCSLFLLDYDRLTAREQNTQNNLEEISQNIVQFEIELNEKEEQLADARNSLTSLEDACTAAAEQSILADRQSSSIREQVSNIQTRLESLQENLQRISAEKNTLLEKKSALQNSIFADEKAKQDAQNNLALACAKLSKCEKNSVIETNKQTKLQEEIESKKNSIIENMNALSKTEAGKSRLIAIKEQMQSRIVEFEQNKEKLHQANSEYAEKLAEKEAQLNAQKTKQQALQEASLQSNQNLEQCILALRQQQTIFAEKNQNYHNTFTKLKTMQDMASEYEGYAPSVKFAMHSSNKHNLQGVYGTVANLFTVPQEYETAIDMVLGGTLQNIVVENEQTAKFLIEDLRKERAGRATFLPISNVKSSLPNANEEVLYKKCALIGLASDLIQYNSKFKGIAENLLGRTLIVKDLNDGIALRNHGCKLRIVTLLGDVMHSGGSMTGGSVKTTNSSFLSRKRMIDEMSTSVQNSRVELQALEQEIQSLRNKREELEILRKQAEQNEHLGAIEFAKFSEIYKSAAADMENYLQEEQSIEDAILGLQESIAALDEELSVLLNENDSAQENTDKLHAEIASLTKQMNEQNALCDVLNKELMSLRLQYADYEHIYNQFLKDERKAQDSIAEFAEKLEQISNEENESKLKQIELSDQETHLSKALLQSKEKYQELSNAQKELESARSATAKNIRMLQEEESNVRDAHLKALDKQHKLELTLSNIVAERSALADSLWNSFELSYESAEQYRPDANFSIGKANQRLKDLKAEIRSLGTVNVNAVEEYKELKERHEELVIQRDDLTASIKDLNGLIKTLLQNMEVQFLENFNQLKVHFAETFTRLFGGGSGEIQLIDPDQPLDCGIEIIVQPPGKKKQLLSLFSGGERALTAIALIFAMLKLRPSPFCILDEVEAALDDANINYFADYLKEFSNKTQFIVVTHRKGTMERCDSLYGVAMAEKGVSTMLSIDISEYKE